VKTELQNCNTSHFKMYFCNITSNITILLCNKTNIIYFYTIYADNFLQSISCIMFITGWWPSLPKHVVKYTKSLTTKKLCCDRRITSMHFTLQDVVKTFQCAMLSVANVAAVSKACVSHVVITDSRKSDLRAYVSHRHNVTITRHDNLSLVQNCQGGDRQTDILSSQSCECTVLSLWKQRGLAKNNGSGRLAQSVTLRPVVSRWPVVISPALKKYLK
jgi:hypothetical protein